MSTSTVREILQQIVDVRKRMLDRDRRLAGEGAEDDETVDKSTLDWLEAKLELARELAKN